MVTPESLLLNLILVKGEKYFGWSEMPVKNQVPYWIVPLLIEEGVAYCMTQGEPF